MTKQANKGVPESVLQMLKAADKRQGFPEGTMASVMQQEVGGQFDKYIGDPAAYHYAAGADGRRVAGHTGKVSTAFGPFGILESTGADPGYGVKPLQGKGLEEQVRFASDYLAARSKRSGGLQAGLAGYGEGAKYGQQVASRLKGAAPVPAMAAPGGGLAPVMVAQAPMPEQMPAPVAAAQAQPAPVAQAMPAGPNTWEAFHAAARNRPPVSPDQLSYGPQEPNMAVHTPDFMSAVMGMQAQRPDFRSFGAWGAAV
jgi:hypothetical protein